MLVRTAGLSRSKEAPFARAAPASDATPSGPWPCPAFDVVAGAATGAPLVIACFTLGLALKQPLTSTAPTNHVTCAARPAPPHRFRRSNIPTPLGLAVYTGVSPRERGAVVKMPLVLRAAPARYVPPIEGGVTRAHVFGTRVMKPTFVSGEWSAVPTPTPLPPPKRPATAVSLYMQSPRLQRKTHGYRRYQQ